MPNALRLLVVEDEQELREILVQGLAKRGFNVAAAADGDAGLATLSEQEFDVVLLDLRMPRRDGIQVLQQMRTDGHDAEVIIVTGHADIETAVEALKLHAFDYLTKPFQMAELLQTVARAAEYRRLRLENRSLRRAVSQHEIEPLLYGSSRAMDRLRGLLDRASARRDLQFLALNCAALPDELLESELFGHERGAFTGATARRHGLLELAHMGTLFLDEVGETSVAMQAKLLRALDGGEIRRLGGDRTLYVDVRIIAATNKDLPKAVSNGEFRPDLYYRLGVVVIEMSPLRERVEDIPLLVEHFAEQVAPAGRAPIKVTAEAMGLLTHYHWPGNVRELRNVVERLSVLSEDGEVTAAEVALYLPAVSMDDIDTSLISLDDVERRHVLKVLQHCG